MDLYTKVQNAVELVIQLSYLGDRCIFAFALNGLLHLTDVNSSRQWARALLSLGVLQCVLYGLVLFGRREVQPVVVGLNRVLWRSWTSSRKREEWLEDVMLHMGRVVVSSVDGLESFPPYNRERFEQLGRVLSTPVV